MGLKEQLDNLDDDVKELVIKKNEEDKLYQRPNRAQRRRRPPADPWFTKATHKFKKIRKKNAKRNAKRRLAAKRARKARQKGNTQVS